MARYMRRYLYEGIITVVIISTLRLLRGKPNIWVLDDGDARPRSPSLGHPFGEGGG
jgi:hypothetical protein